MTSSFALTDLGRIVALIAERPDATIRYGAEPRTDAGRGSIDTESGLELPGLSVNPLAPQPWWSRPVEHWVARQICQYRHLDDGEGDERRAWVVAGREAGHGPEGREPAPGASSARSLGPAKAQASSSASAASLTRPRPRAAVRPRR